METIIREIIGSDIYSIMEIAEKLTKFGIFATPKTLFGFFNNNSTFELVKLSETYYDKMFVSVGQTQSLKHNVSSHQIKYLFQTFFFISANFNKKRFETNYTSTKTTKINDDIIMLFLNKKIPNNNKKDMFYLNRLFDKLLTTKKYPSLNLFQFFIFYDKLFKSHIIPRNDCIFHNDRDDVSICSLDLETHETNWNTLFENHEKRRNYFSK